MNFIRTLGALLLLSLTGQVAQAQSEYAIRSGDSLTIEVLEDNSLNRTVVVLPDGRFSFPFAGTVTAAGRTIAQVQASVRDGIASNFAVQPTVFVSVTPATPRPSTASSAPAAAPTISIYFVGEVGSTGEKAVEPGTTFLQAIAASGGFTNFAATKRIQLRRTDPSTGLQSVYEINYRALSDGAVLQNDFPLQDGDVILVPERRLFE
jgi:polysaccharide export outer membrane protein